MTKIMQLQLAQLKQEYREALAELVRLASRPAPQPAPDAIGVSYGPCSTCNRNSTCAKAWGELTACPAWEHPAQPAPDLDQFGGHTPGPWEMETVKTSCGICHKIGPFPYGVDDTNHACVYVDSRAVHREELKANARLIAAAPSLLARLKDALSDVAMHDFARKQVHERLDSCETALQERDEQLREARADVERLREELEQSREDLQNEVTQHGVTAMQLEQERGKLSKAHCSLRAADVMAKVCDDWVDRREISSRSALADARLDYGQPHTYEHNKHETTEDGR